MSRARRNASGARSAGLRVACLALASGALLLVMPAISAASTVTLRADPDPARVGDVIVYLGAPDELNAVSAQFEPGPEGGGVWTFSDAGAEIAAADPCTAIDAHTVRCPARVGRFIDHAAIELGDGDDRFRSSSPLQDAAGAVRVHGGAGDDELIGGSDVNGLNGGDGNDSLTVSETPGVDFSALDGGPGDDRLVGAAGGDELNGGGGLDELFGRGGDDLLTDGDRDGAAGGAAPGPDLLDGGSDGCCLTLAGDRVSYRGRNAPVSVDLADERADGEAGEGDVLVGIESLEGGSAGDRLLGDEHANALIGHGGRDRLVGRGEADHLVPGTDGGPLTCGSGLDWIVRPRSQDLVDPDCESVQAPEIGITHLPANPGDAGRGFLRYHATCPDLDRCSGSVRIREASGAERLLASGEYPPRRWESVGVMSRRIKLRLTPVGSRLASRRGGVRATMRVEIRTRARGSTSSNALRWTIQLELDR